MSVWESLVAAVAAALGSFFARKKAAPPAPKAPLSKDDLYRDR